MKTGPFKWEKKMVQDGKTRNYSVEARFKGTIRQKGGGDGWVVEVR